MELPIIRKTFLLISLFLLALLTSAVFIFVYLQEKQVQGAVLQAHTGLPVPGAALIIASTRLQADAHGQFSAYLSNPKNVSLSASAPGYLPAAFTFDLPWYIKTGHLNVSLAPSGLSAKIVNAEDGLPLENAALVVGEQTFWSDKTGLIELDPAEVTPPVTLALSLPGYVPRQFELSRLPQDSAELPIVIALTPHRLTGQVQDADSGLALVGVTVTAGAETLTTDAAGAFSFTGLISGTAIHFAPDDRYLPAGITFANQDQITVLLTPRRLVVTVMDGFAGIPITGAQVSVPDLPPLLTDAQGRAVFSPIPLTGTAQISHATYLSQTLVYDQHSLTPTVTLNPNQVQGVIRNAQTGEPIAGVRVVSNNTVTGLPEDAHYRLINLNQPLQVTLKHPDYRLGKMTLAPAAALLNVDRRHIEAQPCRETPEDASAPCLDLLLTPFEAKAIYIPFALLSQPDTIRGMFDFVDQTELNAVVVDVKSDDGSLAWDSQVGQADLLGQDGDRDGWMTLLEFNEEAHRRDIYTIARIVTFKDDPLAFGNPALAVTRADGSIWLDGETLGWANPFREEVWDYNIALAQEVAARGFDEINFDYIRFPSDGDLGAIVYAEENTAETRTTAIRTFTSRARQALEPLGVFVSADVFGLTVWVEPESDMNIGQRVMDIAPSVDYLCPMVYPSTFVPGNLGYDDPSAHPYDVIYRSQLEAMDRMPDTTRVRPWLQAYWYSTDEMLTQKQAANDAGSAGWLWWNAGGVYDEAVFDWGN